MKEEKVVFEGIIDGKQFDDYGEFTKYLQEHPESRSIKLAMNTESKVQKPENEQASKVLKTTSKTLEETRGRLENTYSPTTGRVVEKGQVYNPDELLYPVLETPDHYLALHDPSCWMSDLDWVVNSLKHFLTVHERNIQSLDNEEINKHYKTLKKCYSDVIEALNYNVEAAKHVDSSKAGYKDEVTRLNAQIKELKQRINEIRREHLSKIDNKQQALTATGKLLEIYKDAYYQLLTQTTNESDKRRYEMYKEKECKKATAPNAKTSANAARENGMIRLLNAIFGA